MEQTSNRTGWIIAGAILIAAALIVGFLVWSNGAECRNWQKEAEARVRAIEDAYTEPDKLEAQKALVEIADEQPNGCPDPDF